MKILSIDASTKSTGYAVFNQEKNELEKYGLITASSKDLIKRIHKIIIELNSVLVNYSIDKIVLEEVFPEKEFSNIKTHKALMYLQGAIMFLLHDRFPRIEIEFIYPNSWRSVCGIHTGRGIKRSSLKEKDIEFAKSYYKIKEDINDDIADAIGIGHAYLIENDKIEW